MLSIIGLGLVVLAWAYQLLKVIGGSRTIQTAFVGLYAVGVLLLVADGIMAEFTELALLNLMSLAIAVIICFFLIRRG